jgi:hypothetical protein
VKRIVLLFLAVAAALTAAALFPVAGLAATADTTPPTLVSTDPAGGAALAAPPAAIVLRYDEPLAVAPVGAWLPGVPLLRVGVSGTDVTVTPLSTFAPHASYILTVDGVRDLAGNQAAQASVSFSVDRVPAGLVLSPASVTLTYPQHLTLAGSLLLAGVPVTLDRTPGGAATPEPVATATSAPDGGFSFAVAPDANAVYTAGFAGDADHVPGQAQATVRVRPRLTFSTPSQLWMGATVHLKGRVAPASPGGSAVIQRRLGEKWRDWKTVTLDDASRFDLRWKPTRYGVHWLRLKSPGGALHAEAHTPRHRVVVDNPNPHHISVLYPHFIVVDLSECHLYYYEHGRVVKIFDCVVGKPSTPTPVGQWTVYQKVVGMWGPYGPYTMWYHSPYHFGIHGTNEPWLLDTFPRHYSHGCTRLSNAHITWLFPRVPVGTPVRNIP